MSVLPYVVVGYGEGVCLGRSVVFSAAMVREHNRQKPRPNIELLWNRRG